MEGKNYLNKIAGIVVLYNPDLVVESNVDSYIHHINFLYIIDNSENINHELIDRISKYQKIEYIHNNANLGIAAALNIGVEKAIKSGYWFLLTMDQDSRFESGGLEILIQNITNPDITGIFSPFHKNRFSTKLPEKNGAEEVSDVMTSGNILNLSAVQKVGSFREDYFIDYVDIEYCLRLRRNGFNIIRINNSFLIHNEANLAQRKIFGFTVYPQNHSAVRWYYKIRNYLYLKQQYYLFFKEYFDKERKNIRNSIIKVLLFEDEKIKKLNMMFKGKIHFHKQIKGKYPF